jgi:hypothetical protein
VSALEGNATLRVPVVNGVPYGGWGTIEPKNQLAEFPPHTVQEFRVRTVRPDQMALGDIGFVKIDVESHELDLLAGLSGLRARCLPNLLIEIGARSAADHSRKCGVISTRSATLALLRVLAHDTELTGSPNVIFIPMNAR